MTDAEPSTPVRIFLIADVRGYSRFTLEQGDEAAARLAGRFAEVVEEMVAVWEGKVIELRGDEALAVFASARQALRAAVALQDRFARETEANPSLPLTVGLGLDAGEAIPVKGGFRGAALNLAARLQSVAQSGEVLASEGVIHLARKTEGISYIERGTIELKGFGDAVRVVQVVRVEEEQEKEGAAAYKELKAPGAVGRFDVSLLGPFALRRDGKPLATDRWQRRMGSLFKVIATAPNHRRSRDEIIDLLWPEAPPQAGAGNLRLVAHLLRRALGGGVSPDLPSPLLSERSWLGLDPAYTWEIDLQRFEQLSSTAGDRLEALEEAAALYRGEPLVEDLYEDWAVPIRERVQRRWRELCLRLAGLYHSRRAVETAAGWYEQALEADSLDEGALRGLLEVLGDLGRTTEALRRFRQFEQKLEEEIGVPPMPETLAVVERFKAALDQAPPMVALPTEELVRPRLAGVVPTYPLPAPWPLVGRPAELDTVLIELPGENEHVPGPARLVLVAAEPGMGKTRLLSEVARRAGEADMLLLAGGCYEEEGRLPYGPVHDALLDFVQAQPEATLLSQLGDLLPLLAEIVPEVRARILDLPEVRSSDPQAQRLRLFSTVAQALQRISAERPLVLLLDDLHWADDPSLQLLHFLLRQTDMERALVVGAYRSDEVRPGTLLAQLVTRSGDQQNVKVVELAPLSEPDMELLLADRLAGECSRELVTTLHERSTGNPFFSLQMMRLLQQEGSLRKQDGRWTLAPGARVDLPPAVRETVARRLRHVTLEVRNTLAFGAVLGREFDYVALEAVADLGEDALFGSLDAAHEAGLLRETGNGYAFVHPLLWEVIYQRVPDQRRRRLHDRAGLALEGLYGEGSVERAPELAWHFLESGNAPRALQYSLLAAGRAERVVAHAEAERYYRAALPLARSLGDRRREAEALAGLGSVLKALGRLDEALDALEEAADAYQRADDLEGEGRVVALMGLVHYFRGSYDAGVARLEPVAARLEQQGRSRSLALLYASLPRVYLPAKSFVKGLAAAERAVALAQELGDETLIPDAVFVHGRALLESGRVEEAIPALEEAIHLAEALPDLFVLTAACAFASYAYLARGEIGRSKAYCERSVKAAEERGGLEQVLGGLAQLSDTSFLVGDWEAARKYAERHLSTVLARGDKPGPMSLRIRGTLALHTGDWEQAARHLTDYAALMEHVNRPKEHLLGAQGLLAELYLLQGDFGPALARLEPLLAHPDWRERVDFLVPLAWAQVEAEKLTHARGTVQMAISAMQRPRTEAAILVNDAHLLVDVLRIKGMVLAQEGNTPEAERAFQEAVTLAKPMPYPYGEARALYEWGRSLAEQRELEQARPRLEEALTIFRRLGAHPYIARTEQALVQLGAEAT